MSNHKLLGVIMYYIYCLINPINDECFYVGKGKGYRYKDHLNGYRSNRYVQAVIKQIRDAGLEPVVDIDHLDEDEDVILAAEYMFQRWIDPKCNLFMCGKFGFAGGKSIPKTEEHKKKIGLAHKGVPKSEESKAKMSISQKKARKEGRIVSMPPNNKGDTYKMKLVKCPHCFKEGNGGNMTRYHFNNCKRQESNELL